MKHLKLRNKDLWELGDDLSIENYLIGLIQLQLGITNETYRFNGILGVDFMEKSGSLIVL